MKPTGIVRRIDDLGRVVIPKELRKMMNVREGDPLEMYVSDKKLVLQKHSEFAAKKDITEQLVKGHDSKSGIFLAIIDTDTVVAVNTGRIPTDREIENNILSKELMGIVAEYSFPYKDTVFNPTEEVKLIQHYDYCVKRVYRISPHVGAVAFFTKGNKDVEITPEMDTIAKYITKILNNDEF